MFLTIKRSKPKYFKKNPNYFAVSNILSIFVPAKRIRNVIRTDEPRLVLKI